MVTEFIKRKQRMGFDENGALVYKISENEPSPLEAVEEVLEEEEVDEFSLFDDE